MKLSTRDVIISQCFADWPELIKTSRENILGLQYNLDPKKVVLLYELEYKLFKLESLNSSKPSTLKSIERIKKELSSLLPEVLQIMKKIFASWLEMHKESVDINTEDVRQRIIKEYPELSLERIDKEMLNMALGKHTEYTDLFRKIEFQAIKDAWSKPPFSNIMKTYQELKKGPSGNIGKDIALFNHSLNTTHFGGPFLNYFSDITGVSGSLLSELSEGKFIDKWDREIEKFSKFDISKIAKTKKHKSAGIFISLPKDIAKQFKSLGEHDTSKPHITLLFIGDVPKSDKKKIIDTTKKVFEEQKPFEIKLDDKVSYFDAAEHSDNCKVAKINIISKELHALHNKLKKALKEAGIEIQDNFPDYKPHATLEYMEPPKEKYDGDVPKGSCVVDCAEIWGWGEKHKINFGEKKISKRANKERPYIELGTKEDKIIYGPFKNEREAIKAYFFHRPSNLLKEAWRQGNIQKYIYKNLAEYDDYELQYVMFHPKEFGINSIELRGPDELHMDASWKEEKEDDLEYFFGTYVGKREATMEISKRAKTNKILILVASKDFQDDEYAVPKKMLENAGFNVDVASDKEIATSMNGITIKVNKLLKDVNPSEYNAMLVVGGKGAIELSKNKDAQNIARQMASDKKLLAGICHGPLLYGEVGLLKNRVMTGWPESEKDFMQMGGDYTKAGTEVDDSLMNGSVLITGRDPNAAQDFAKLIIERLEGKEKTAMISKRDIDKRAKPISSREVELKSVPKAIRNQPYDITTPYQVQMAEDGLKKYKSKREFDETPEPEGKVEKTNKHRFVIQKHDAHKAGTHFDLRLENDEGTMTSWAIPKAKLPGKGERLLAMETEPHPISYRSFGKNKTEKNPVVIPAGQYGAGTVYVWADGKYKTIEWTKNKIVFEILSGKAKGKYTLVHTQGNKWLWMQYTKKD